jgi:hypothetical protein
MVTLLELRDQVRQRADQEDSFFIEDSELNGYINASIFELYDLLVSTSSDYYLADGYQFTLSSGEYTKTFPTDFYKLRKVERQNNSGDWIMLKQFNFNESYPTSRSRGAVMYRPMGNKLYFRPENAANFTYRMWYIPRFTPLVDDTDEFDGISGWEEYVVIDAAIKCMIKAEDDYSGLSMLKGQMMKRIEAIAAERDYGEPQVIPSSRGSYFNYDDEDIW